MRKLLLLAGAAAFLGAAPAAAKPGHGHGGKPAQAKVVKVKTVKPAKVKAVKAKKVKTKRLWTTACPRGLVWRGDVCVPPGHSVRLLRVGTRVPTGWAYTPWGAVPVDLRTRYDLDPAYRYVYRNNVIYVVDPRTRLITSIMDAVL